MSSNDELLTNLSAIALSAAIGQLKTANPVAFQTVKADVNMASRFLGDLSKALNDDNVTMEEALIIMKDISDPSLRETAIGFLNSIMTKCQISK